MILLLNKKLIRENNDFKIFLLYETVFGSHYNKNKYIFFVL